ncbi:hypothetical protein KJ652_00030, partial [Patescibacteria group bacterium]|nr:hypothetical protein [Patescibacteria group bacterium]
PEMAQSENAMFEMVWRRGVKEGGGEDKVEVEEEVGLKTKVVAGVREFFLSRKSIAAFALCAVLAASVTFGLYRYSVNLNTERVRERVMAIAATAAPEIDADDLDLLHTWRDSEKTVYKKVVMQLQHIRERNEGVVYVYIMRLTNNPYYFEFVADADSLDINSDMDLTKDGLRNDTLAPGHLYYDYTAKSSPIYKSMINGTIESDAMPYADIWGTWIAGNAPIKDDFGKVVAVIGVDIDASEIQILTNRSFKIVVWFIVLFLLFVFIRIVLLIKQVRIIERYIKHD